MQELRFQHQLTSLQFPKTFSRKCSLLWNPPKPLGLWICSMWVDCWKLQDWELTTKLWTCPGCVIRPPFNSDPYPLLYFSPLHPLLVHQCQAVASSRMEHVFPFFFPARCPKHFLHTCRQLPGRLAKWAAITAQQTHMLEHLLNMSHKNKWLCCCINIVFQQYLLHGLTLQFPDI